LVSAFYITAHARLNPQDGDEDDGRVGLLEIRHWLTGEWQLVSSSYMDQSLAKVVCRQLGLQQG